MGRGTDQHDGLTKVANLRTPGVKGVYIGRPSPFGNPYALGPDGDRAEVIRKFQSYFFARLKMDAEFKAKVDALKGQTLLCYCSPLACHGDTIVAYLEQGISE